MNKNTYIAVFVGVALIAIFIIYQQTDLFRNTPVQPVGDESEVLESSVEGVIIQDNAVGTGEEAVVGKVLTVHYAGAFEDGTIFESSVPNGDPFQFILGAGQVIPGWDQGLVGMKVGGRRVLVIPPELAYGAEGNGPIPPNATLIFEVELLNVQDLADLQAQQDDQSESESTE